MTNKELNERLLLSAQNGDLKTVVQLVDAGAELNITDEDGETPLMLALGEGHPKVAKYIESKGADFNKLNNDGQSIVHVAVYSSDAECVSFSLSKLNNIKPPQDHSLS